MILLTVLVALSVDFVIMERDTFTVIAVIGTRKQLSPWIDKKVAVYIDKLQDEIDKNEK